MKHVGLAIVVALLLPGAVAGNSGDAGTGTDAPSDESVPFVIGGDRSYIGQLPRGDRDWYTTYDAAGALACYTLDAMASSMMDTTLVLRDLGSREELRATAAPWEPVQLALAATRLDDARLGFVNTASGGGGYGFDVHGYTMADFATDANSGGDSPSDAQGAPLIDPGCTGGRVGGVLDIRDAMSFDGNAGDLTILSIAAPPGADVRLDILDAEGDLLGSVVGAGSLALQLPDSGTYTMSTSSSSLSEVSYLVGLVVGPPGQGCRPACLSS